MLGNFIFCHASAELQKHPYYIPYIPITNDDLPEESRDDGKPRNILSYINEDYKKNDVPAIKTLAALFPQYSSTIPEFYEPKTVSRLIENEFIERTIAMIQNRVDEM